MKNLPEAPSLREVGLFKELLAQLFLVVGDNVGIFGNGIVVGVQQDAFEGVWMRQVQAVSGTADFMLAS